MNALVKLREIRNYLEMNRGVGHTHTMLNGAKNTDCIVLSHNLAMGKYLERAAGKKLNIQSINNPHMLHGYQQPLAIDNAALWSLFTDVLEEVKSLEKEIVKLKQKKK